MKKQKTDQSENQFRGFVRPEGACQYLSISLRTLRDWQKRRLLRCYQPTARTHLYKLSDLDACMERFSTGGAA